MLFLHGSGERGDDGALQTTVGLGPLLRARPEVFPGVVVLPQCPPHAIWADEVAELALAALEEALTEYGGDRRRVYLAGMSMGGFGTWYLALRAPGMFAALVPICGFTSTRLIGTGRPGPGRDLPDVPVPGLEGGESVRHAAVALRVGKVPVWLFHGADDPLVPVSESRGMAAALRAGGGEVRYTEYAGVEHNSWDRALAEPELWPWILAAKPLSDPKGQSSERVRASGMRFDAGSKD
ncbi:MAG TPA: prolyl oligopeptidase family serine peptidase [Polyangia bacterium]|nr:prolyl oligopeptidase family serine peptidase [Polyangia bacterium]